MRLEDTEITSVCARDAVVRTELLLAFLDNNRGILNKEALDFVDMRLEVSLLSARRSVTCLRRLWGLEVSEDLVSMESGRSVCKLDICPEVARNSSRSFPHVQSMEHPHGSGLVASVAETGTRGASLGTAALLENLSNKLCLSTLYSSSLNDKSYSKDRRMAERTNLSKPSEFAEASSFRRWASVTLDIIDELCTRMH